MTVLIGLFIHFRVLPDDGLIVIAMLIDILFVILGITVYTDSLCHH